MLTCVNALGKCRDEKMLTLRNVDLWSTGFMSNWGNGLDWNYFKSTLLEGHFLQVHIAQSTTT